MCCTVEDSAGLAINRSQHQSRKKNFAAMEIRICVCRDYSYPLSTYIVLITQVFASLRVTNKFYFSNALVNKEAASAQMSTSERAVLKS